MNQIVANLRKGWKLHYTDGSVYEVLGGRQLRKTYWYVVRNSLGQKVAIRREAYLEDAKTGLVTVSA